MRFVPRMFATMVFAVLVAGPVLADDTPKPVTGNEAGRRRGSRRG